MAHAEKGGGKEEKKRKEYAKLRAALPLGLGYEPRIVAEAKRSGADPKRERNLLTFYLPAVEEKQKPK